MLNKIKKLKQKSKQKVHHYANQVFAPSSERVAELLTSASINNSGINTLVPTAALLESPPNPKVLSSSQTSPQAAAISTMQPVVLSPALPSPDKQPLPTTQTNEPHSAQESTPFQVASSASVVSPSAERSSKKAAWSGLKTLLGLLNEGAEAFGPLKSAVGGILKCIEIYERAAKGRDDYQKLETELESLFWELFGYLNGPAPPAMTPSLVNLAKGIEKEIGFVLEKEKRSKIERGAEAMEDANEVLECYLRVQRLLERFSLNANVSTWKTVDELATERRLDKLSPSQAAQYVSAESTELRRNGCIPNTRIDLLSQLSTWAEDSSSKRIYWLNGMAGTGKTTIAYSLCDQLEGNLTLAASFFCSRQLPACRNVSLIIPTVAYQLARFSLPYRHALSNALEQSPDVPTLIVSKQFQKLIVEPLLAIEHAIPPNLVVVIDALDECDNKDGVDQILKTLLSHATGLPIKFFVTSRPEPRILDQMKSEQSRGVPMKLDLHNLERSVVREDIKTYLTVKLDSPMLTLTDANLDKLVNRSGVLFIYAATVVRYIGVDNFSRSAKRLEQVLDASSPSQRDTSMEIDILYDGILGAALDDKTLTASERGEMKDVLHTVICAQEPMTVGVIAGLLKLDTNSVKAALRPLNSVLHWSSELGGVVTTFHESFPDYMLDKNRSGTLFCDSHSHNALLAQECFGLIRSRNPPFNICNLESSYVFDKDVPDIDRRVETAISAEMFYACRYWASHIMLAETSSNLSDALHDFLSVRLLLWMEVMNLKQCMSTGVGLLHRIQTWLQNATGSNETQELALDAWRFALDFSTSPMSRSTPHMYMSALLFWPDHRPISKYYISKMRDMTKVTGTAMRGRKSAPLAVCTTPGSVSSVAYSFDGTLIVSGSYDSTIRIWDAQTGQMVGEPLEGHTGSVTSVAYSRDGTRIVSSSYDSTICIWDAQTGHMVGEPHKGHTGSVHSVAYSHDSTHIVSGSSDSTIRIWDAQTDQMVGEPLQGHTGSVHSVAYSHDSTRIVSSSSDGTIRIWDAQTGQMVGQPLKSHTGSVNSVTYSHDSTRIVSGSNDGTICIWNAQTGQMVGEPLKGHTGSVHSVAYSHDSTRIISGSWDNTIRIWDAQTGQMVGQPLEGHTGSVNSVACSHDSTHIVSGSWDNTILIWDAQTGQIVGQPLESHTGSVNSVAYSHDSTRIVSGSDDSTIRIWNAQTGQMVGQPLEGHTGSVNSVAYSHDSTRIVSGSWDNTIRIWDAQNGQMVGEPLEGHTGSVNSVAYSHDSTHIISGSDDNTILIWDAQTGQMVGQPLEGHTRLVNSVAYSHDSTHIVSGSWDNTIRIWDAQTGQMVGEPLEGHTRLVNSVAYSHDSTRIVSGSWDNTIRIWDAQTGQMVGQPLQGHTGSVTSIAYSHDSTRIVSGSNDGTICIWDAQTGQMVGEPLEGHTGSVNSVAYSHDGTRTASGSSDNALRVWDAHTSQIGDGTLDGYIAPVRLIPSQEQLASNTLPNPNPPLSNAPTANLHTDWTLDKDGWVLEGSKLLIWVPPDVRGLLQRPRTLIIISASGSLVLDFSVAQLGANWHHCYCYELALPIQ